MHKVLIVDQDKASTVMTSECFKDVLSDIKIRLASNYDDCITEIRDNKISMIIIDGDSPNIPAFDLMKSLREKYSGPIIFSFFPNKEKNSFIENNFFDYNDATSWLSKPVRNDQVHQIIQEFLIQKKSIRKNFSTDIETSIIFSKKIRRDKGTEGLMINLTKDQALIRSNDQILAKKGQSIIIRIDNKEIRKQIPNSEIKNNKNLSLVLKPKEQQEINCKVLKSNKSKKEITVKFHNLSHNHHEAISNIIKNSNEC